MSAQINLRYGAVWKCARDVTDEWRRRRRVVCDVRDKQQLMCQQHVTALRTVYVHTFWHGPYQPPLQSCWTSDMHPTDVTRNSNWVGWGASVRARLRRVGHVHINNFRDVEKNWWRGVSAFLPSLPLPLEVVPLNQLGGSGELCKVPQRGPGQSLGRKRIFGAVRKPLVAIIVSILKCTFYIMWSDKLDYLSWRGVLTHITSSAYASEQLEKRLRKYFPGEWGPGFLGPRLRL